jgi:1-acyl-sn-glycerol-3-phosphate acyltransferase
MIIKAHHHFIVYPAFKVFTLISIKRNFHEVRIIGDFEDKKLPVFTIANHFSWWDGLFVNFVNMKLFKRKFNFMMLEEQLEIHKFFRNLGGYSIKKNSRSMVESIRYTRELLQEKSNLVLMFPQGEIQSLYKTGFIFEQGVDRILNKLNNEIQILFIANLVDYFSYPKPTVYAYLKEHKSDDQSLQELQKAYNTFYYECVETNKKIIDRI